MHRIVLAVLLALTPTVASAQVIKTHNAPDRTQYDSPADWPVVSSQCHWSAIGANTQGDRVDTLGFNPTGEILDAAHVHVEVKFPLYGELSGPITVPFTVVLRDLKGIVFLWGARPWQAADATNDSTDWFWDATQSSTAPLMRGDPNAAMGVQTFTGHFTFHPRHDWHGFDAWDTAGQAQFDNGDQMTVHSIVSYWNNVDPNAPITLGTQGAASEPFMGTDCDPIAANAPGDVFGANEMFVNNYLPTSAVNGKWTLPPNSDEASATDPATVSPTNPNGSKFAAGPVNFTNSYGQTIPSTGGSCQTRRDLNFHMGIPGVTVSEIDAQGLISCQTSIDNTGLPVGNHTWGFIRFQPENTKRTNEVASLLVINVPNDSTVGTPPPVCTAPDILVGGQCITPAPPPPVLACAPPAVLQGSSCVTPPPPPPPPPPAETFTTICTVQVQIGTQGSVRTQSSCAAN